MTTRRMLSRAVLGLVAAGWARPRSPAWAAGNDSEEGLGNRGAPTGRVGAGTRSPQAGMQDLTLDLVAPKRGVGLTSSDQPTLCYLLSGATNAPLRLTISTRGQARPLADMTLPRSASRMGVVNLRQSAVHLVPGQLYVWSVALRLDPKDPARDLVASALIQYKPSDPGFEKAVRDAPVAQRYALLARNDYWYDEVALAAGEYAHDQGVALAGLLRDAGLQGDASGHEMAH